MTGSTLRERFVRGCLECALDSGSWRQCPDNDCRKDICYCPAHGGDARAVTEMTAHIQAHCVEEDDE